MSNLHQRQLWLKRSFVLPPFFPEIAQIFNCSVVFACPAAGDREKEAGER